MTLKQLWHATILKQKIEVILNASFCLLIKLVEILPEKLRSMREIPDAALKGDENRIELHWKAMA